jgi:hypothetical protein
MTLSASLRNNAPLVTTLAGSNYAAGTVLTGTQLFSASDPQGSPDIDYIRVFDESQTGGAVWRYKGSVVTPGSGGFQFEYGNRGLLTYTVGTGSNSFVIEAFDTAGADSNDASLTISGTTNVNNAPLVTTLAGSNYAAGSVLTGTQLFSASDPQGSSDIDYIRVFDESQTGGAVWRYNGSVVTPGSGGFQFEYGNRGLLNYTIGTGSNSFVIEAVDNAVADSNDASLTISGANGVEADIASSTATTASLADGGFNTSRIDIAGDIDWFRLALVAGRTYTLTETGTGTGGALGNPYIRGIYTSAGVLIEGTSNDDFGAALSSRVTFAPVNTGTYYLAAAANQGLTGDYRVALTSVVDSDILATTATSATLAVGGVALSTIGAVGDRDWFRIQLVGGTTYSIEETSNESSSRPLADPFFRGVYDSTGVIIAGTTNDNFGGGPNSRISFTAPTSATYYLAAGANGAILGDYQLSVATTASTDTIADNTGTTGQIAVNGLVNSRIDLARDIDWFRIGLTAGHTYVVEQRGAASGVGTLSDPSFRGIYNAKGVLIAGTSNEDSGNSSDSRVVFTPGTTGTYYLAASGYSEYIGTYRLSVEEAPATSDIPSNALSSARAAVGMSFASSIETVGDVDWIGVNLIQGGAYQVNLQGASNQNGTLANPLIVGIYNSVGQAIPGSGDGGVGVDASSLFTAPSSGLYFVAAAGHGGATGTYQLLVNTSLDTTPPLLVSTSDTTNIAPGAHISFTFNEAVRAGTGNFVIAGGGQTRTISVLDTTQVTFNGEIVTLNPTTDLAAGSYTVTLGSGTAFGADAVRDLAGNNFAGIAGVNSVDVTTVAAPASTDSWTIMVYIAGDNNLEPFGIRDINEMESVQLPTDVNLVVLFDRAPGYDSSNGNWSETRHGAISFDGSNIAISSQLVSIGEQNTGSGATLTNFINWGASNYQASNYGLVVWDHGGGLSGTSWDDTNGGDHLTMNEMTLAVAASNVAHFGMIGFDACLQGMAEQVFALASRTDVIVASEELIPGDGWAYDRWLSSLASNPGMSPVGLASAIVQSYGQEYAGWSNITLSAVDTAALNLVGTRLEQFASLALSASNSDILAIQAAASHAEGFDGNARDIGDFMTEVAARVGSVALRGAALDVNAALGNAVFAESGTVADATGLAIHLPFGVQSIDSLYTAANFPQFFSAVPHWDDFLGLV